MALALGADGSLWAGTISGGLAQLDKDGRWQTYSKASTQGGLPDDNVVALALGADGSLWAGTDGGLARLDKDGRWRTYSKASTQGGLPANSVRALALGADGSLSLTLADQGMGYQSTQITLTLLMENCLLLRARLVIFPPAGAFLVVGGNYQGVITSGVTSSRIVIPNANTPVPIHISGVVIVGNSDGNVQLKWAQASAVSGGTAVQAGSFFCARQTHNPFDLIQRDDVGCAVVELCRARAFVRGHSLGVL